MTATASRPKNFAQARSINVSEGKMWQANWETRNHDTPPLCIYDKAVLASKSYDMSDKKVDTDALQPNPQRGQACALSIENDTLLLNFTIKAFPLAEQVHSCPDDNYQHYLNELFDYAKEKKLFYKLAQLYINNIANARFLWRNRRSASQIETIIWMNGEKITFNSKDFRLDTFVYDDDNINKIALAMAKAFAGEVEFLDLEVKCYAYLGKGMEVFPSQEMTIDGDVGKILFSYEGCAGIHSQKIGNAIRTIDIWYPDYEKYEFALPVEPYGVKRSLGLALRTSQSFYKLIDKHITALDKAPEEDLMYILAVLIRGGLFGTKSDS
jgi:CRISPR-associated protein Csy3